MANQKSQEDILNSEDASNFQYAGMYLAFAATMIFLAIFIEAVVRAYELHDLLLEWEWESVWNTVMNLLVFVGGFVVVYCTYKKRHFPTAFTIVTFMLAVSIIDLTNHLLWATTSWLAFVTSSLCLITLALGHKEFISPKVIREMMAIAKTHQAAHRRRTPHSWQSTQEPRYVPETVPAARKSVITEEEQSCPGCRMVIAGSLKFCPHCGVDIENRIRINQVEKSYRRGSITHEQYARAMVNLKK